MLTHKQELFCLRVSEGHTATEAYRLAYNPQTTNKASINERSSRLRANGKVIARLEELNAENVVLASLTREEVLGDLMGLARNPATKAGERVRCYELIAKLCGYLVNRSEVQTLSQVNVSFDALTMDQLVSLANQGAQATIIDSQGGPVQELPAGPELNG